MVDSKGKSFREVGRLGWAIGARKNQLIILPERTAVKANIIIGVVRRGSSS